MTTTILKEFLINVIAMTVFVKVLQIMLGDFADNSDSRMIKYKMIPHARWRLMKRFGVRGLPNKKRGVKNDPT